MTVSEERRLEMTRVLKEVLGDEAANIMMEHLPVGGWVELARRSDVADLDSRVTLRMDSLEIRMDALEHRMDVLEHRMDMMELRLQFIEQRIKGVAGSMKVMIGMTAAFATAIIVMLVQVNLAVSQL